MMSLIRQLMGCSRREAEGDKLADDLRHDIVAARRKARAQRIALERLVAELNKDITQWH